MKLLSWTGLLLAGLIAVVAVVGFEVSMSATSSDEFCLGCHNHEIPYAEYKNTAHFSNASGVSPSCVDCHLPKEFVPKVMRKIAASRELWGHITGVIDTDEKYLAHREEMKERELARMKANDSAECRSCHNRANMDFEAQSRSARKAHSQKTARTCISCHDGLAHTPEEDDEEDFDF